MRTTESTPFLFFLLLLSCSRPQLAAAAPSDPTPARWPEQFHSLMYMNVSAAGKLYIVDLWYDWPNGRNFNIMQQQLSDVLYDLEWDNGTSFYYTLGPQGSCLPRRFPVGIPRPDFLQEGATYLGRVTTDGFLCDLWVKLDFIWYYEDVATKRPVRWDFFDGISQHVMTFEVGAVLDDPHWQAPGYCFPQDEKAGAGDGEGSPGREVESDLSGFAGALRRLSLLNRGSSPAHLFESTQLAGFSK
ncbi:hypothetical protein Taro_042129 [Colocasia esculenta]|uniref:Uncharacterized protein n=1 Tax=Colocasia esculenta TaxID=4460 RepID=A0A843WXR0_COLES|nr:hypothetical protein [Colocasia esculenta]